MGRSYSCKVIRFAKFGPTFVKSICNIFLIRDVFVIFTNMQDMLECFVLCWFNLITLFNTFQVPFILLLCLSNSVLKYDCSDHLSIDVNLFV